MHIFDSHCHLNDKAFSRDLAAVVENARDAGVTGMMIVGITEPTCRRAIDIAGMYAGCYASVGIHPHDARQCTGDTLDRLKGMARDPKVRAWGELGLDFNRMHSPRDVQETWFVRQLEAASETGLPMIFHERDSNGRFLELLRVHGPSDGRGVVHCFSGTPEELDQYLDMGFSIGITGILTLGGRGAKLREMAAQIPEERLLVETDAPYLTPVPEKNRFRRNEPAFVKRVLLKLAEVRNTDPQRLAAVIWQNTCDLFGIEMHPAAQQGNNKGAAQ